MRLQKISWEDPNKAGSTKLPGAGISPKQWLKKMSGRKRLCAQLSENRLGDQDQVSYDGGKVGQKRNAFSMSRSQRVGLSSRVARVARYVAK